MKKLRIIVSKNSTLLNSYLQNQFYVYDKITNIEDKVIYKQSGLSHPMETITYLIDMFMLSDYSISCVYGDYTFRVNS